jgi:hypothetical protein
MSAEYPFNTSWQQAQEPPYPPPSGPAPQPGVSWLAPVANDRTNFVLIGIGLFFFPIIFLPQGIASFVQSHSPLLLRVGLLLCYSLLPALLITLGILAVKQQQRWNAINQRRQMAAAWGSASGVPLAESHPFPNAGALPPYFTIKHKANWHAAIALACLVTGLFVLTWTGLVISSALLIGVTLQESIGDVFRFPFFPWMLLLSPLVLLVRASLPQHIEITPDGLIVRHPGYDWARSNQASKQRMIGWHEARLFAIRAGKPGASTARYELSSPTTVITFDRILRPHWWLRFRPAEPFGDYHAQIDALLALISARTGLPLYDVRQSFRVETLPGLETPAQEGRATNYRTVLSAVLIALSVGCQMEGFPGVLAAKVHDDYRPVALALEIIACLLALGALWFGYRAPGKETRLVSFAYLCLAFAMIGLILFPFGPFV